MLSLALGRYVKGEGNTFRCDVFLLRERNIQALKISLSKTHPCSPSASSHREPQNEPLITQTMLENTANPS